MSSLVRLVINSNGSADDFKSQCNLAPLGLDGLQSFENYIGGLAGGSVCNADLAFKVGAVQATGTLTVATGGSSNNQTCSICNITLTGKTSSTANNEFSVSATAATQATNMATAINASTDLAGKVTASAELGVVTITAVVPGLLGNGLQMSAGTLSNVTLGAFANGTDGTAYTLNLE